MMHRAIIYSSIERSLKQTVSLEKVVSLKIDFKWLFN